MARLELFRQQAKEFNNLTDLSVTAWISSALIFMDPILSRIKSTQMEMAIALYTAHLCWLDKYSSNGGGMRGPILNEKDDKRQKQYSLIQNSDSWFGQSPYGQAFINMTGIKVGGRRLPALLTSYGVTNFPADNF